MPDLGPAGLLHLRRLVPEFVEFHPASVTAFAGPGPGARPASEQSAQRENEPPEVTDKIEDGLHGIILPSG